MGFERGLGAQFRAGMLRRRGGSRLEFNGPGLKPLFFALFPRLESRGFYRVDASRRFRLFVWLDWQRGFICQRCWRVSGVGGGRMASRMGLWVGGPGVWRSGRRRIRMGGWGDHQEEIGFGWKSGVSDSMGSPHSSLRSIQVRFIF